MSQNTRSQNDSLVILCGGIFKTVHKVIGKGVHVPNYCYKVVVSLKTRSVIMCRLYSNTSRAVGYNVTLKTLEKRLGYELPIAPYIGGVDESNKNRMLRPY